MRIVNPKEKRKREGNEKKKGRTGEGEEKERRRRGEGEGKKKERRLTREFALNKVNVVTQDPIIFQLLHRGIQGVNNGGMVAMT